MDHFKDIIEILKTTNLPPSMWDNRKMFNSYICSTLNAHVLIEAGVINAVKYPLGGDIHWFPKDFSPKNLPRAKSLDAEEYDVKGDWDQDVTLGPQIELLYPYLKEDNKVYAKSMAKSLAKLQSKL